MNKSTLFATVLVVTCLSLVGCSATAFTGTAGAPSGVTEPSTTEQLTIQEETVRALAALCTDATPYALGANNWELTDNNNGSAPFEIYLTGGDGGYIVLLVTPGEPHASLAISPEWADSSNSLLYNSGCTSFTTAPEETWEESPGETTQDDSVVIPNLVGAQNSRVTSMLMSAGIYSSWRREYVQGDPSSACKSQLEGTVVWQNMEPGFSQVLSGANQLVVQIDCSY